MSGAVFTPQMIEAEKKKDEQKVVRVLFSVPNEGHTHVEAYADRLVHCLHLGKFWQMGKTISDFRQLIKKHAPDSEDAIMKDYWLKNAIYKKNLDGKRFEFFFVTMGRIFTPYAREEAAKLAMEHNMDYLYMVDDDMMIPEDLFERLYDHNVDIVAPLAFTRNFPHKPVIYSTIEGWDETAKAPYFKNHFVMKYPKDRLVECDAVGFGAVLIKVDVLRKCAKPLFMSTCGTGEDVYFCLRAREQGFRVFMDTATKLGHLSHPKIITEELVMKMREDLDMEVDKKNAEYTKYPIPKLVLGD